MKDRQRAERTYSPLKPLCIPSPKDEDGYLVKCCRLFQIIL